MPSLAVYRSLKARLDAHPIPGFPARYPNGVGDAPADKSTFVDVHFPVSASERITFGSPGNDTHRETGTVLFVLAARRGDGLDAGLQAAGAIAALFRDFRDGPLIFWEPTTPTTDDANQDGSYFRLSIHVPYWLDFWA